MSMLSGIAQFGLSAMQGYEQKKKELKTEAERLADKQRQITREDSSDAMAKESHALQQETGRYNLDQAKVKIGREDKAYNRGELLRQAAVLHQTDPVAATNLLINIGNDDPMHNQRFEPIKDKDGNVIYDKSGGFTGNVISQDGTVLHANVPMNNEKMYRAMVVASDPTALAKTEFDRANAIVDEQRKIKDAKDVKLWENGLGLSVSEREKLELTAKYNQEKSDETANKALQVLQFKLDNGLFPNTGGGKGDSNPSTGQYWNVPAAGAGLPVAANNASQVARQLAGAQKTIAQYKLPVDPAHASLVTAMMGIESAGVVNARSPNGGGAGVMQLNPQYHAEANGTVEQNFAKGQAEIIRLNKKYNGNADMVAAAYNAGEGGLSNAMKKAKSAGRPNDWISFLPKETQGHVAKFREAIALQGGTTQQAAQPAQTQPDTAQQIGRQVLLEGKLNANVEKNIATLAPLIGLESEEPEARLALTQLSKDLSLIVNIPTDQRQAYYAKALVPILEKIDEAYPELPKAKVEELGNQIAAKVLGFGSVGEIALQLGFATYRNKAADGLPKNAKPSNLTPKQQAATTVVPNPMAKPTAPMVQGKTGGVPNTAPAPLVSGKTTAAYPKKLPTAVGKVDNELLDNQGI